MHRVALAALLIAPLWLAGAARAALVFTTGNYYTSTYFSREINEFDSSGAPVGSLTIPSSLGTEVRGMAFGPDGLLYATVARSSGLAVLALDRNGNVHRSYEAGVYVGGNISHGKLAVSSTHVYVAAGNDLMRFELGDPSSGISIYTNNQVFDVELEPNGNLFVASAYRIEEIDGAGQILRTVGGPLGGAAFPNFLTDVRGIEFDPVSNDLFVTHLGHSGFFFQLMRLDASTGVLEQSIGFNYADDIFLTLAGELLVGSRTQVPRFFSKGLDLLGTLDMSFDQMFVTQRTVPEPTASWLVVLSVVALASRRR